MTRSRLGAIVCMVWMASVGPLAAQTPAFDSRGWVVGHQQRNATESLTEYVLPGQTVDNWRELVTSTVFFQPVPVERLVDQIHTLMSKDCPSLVWNVVRQDQRTIIFEWRDSGCGGDEPQAELDRITIEKDGLYRLAYAVKMKGPVPADRRKQWLAIFDQVPLAEGPVGQQGALAKPAPSPGPGPSTGSPAQKLSTEQLATGIRNVGWPCVAPVKSEVKGLTSEPGPKGLFLVYAVECANAQRYTVLVDPTGAITSFPTLPK
jgi:hypothetical protein